MSFKLNDCILLQSNTNSSLQLQEGIPGQDTGTRKKRKVYCWVYIVRLEKTFKNVVVTQLNVARRPENHHRGEFLINKKVWVLLSNNYTITFTVSTS